MILKFVRRFASTRKRSAAVNSKNDGTQLKLKMGETPSKGTTAQLNEWRAALTAPIDQLCEAPSADAVRHAYGLYAEEVYAPFAARDARMAELLASIRKGLAELMAGAPGLVESALSQHPQVFAELRRLQSGGKP
jgi:hypothetical protein